MKSMYTNGQYDDNSRALDSEASGVLRPIIEKWFKMGFSIREISHLIQGAVTDIEVTIIIDEKYKK